MTDFPEGEQEPTYKELMGQINGTFQDEGFPPDQRSVLTNESVFELNSDETKVLEGLEYARVKDIYSGSRVKLFDKIDPNAIQQG
jgi:hypothetical protein